MKQFAKIKSIINEYEPAPFLDKMTNKEGHVFYLHQINNKYPATFFACAKAVEKCMELDRNITSENMHKAFDYWLHQFDLTVERFMFFYPHESYMGYKKIDYKYCSKQHYIWDHLFDNYYG